MFVFLSGIPANILMLGNSRRRWPNIKITLGYCYVFARSVLSYGLFGSSAFFGLVDRWWAADALLIARLIDCWWLAD